MDFEWNCFQTLKRSGFNETNLIIGQVDIQSVFTAACRHERSRLDCLNRIVLQMNDVQSFKQFHLIRYPSQSVIC